MVAEGKITKEIADRLNISVHTVETHRAKIMRKLDVHTVGELVRYARANGFTLAARRNADGTLIP